MDRDNSTIGHRLAELSLLNGSDLRAAWVDLFGQPALKNLSRDLLMRAIAHRMQEEELGGLRSATARRLRRLADDIAKDSLAPINSPTPLSPGSRLMREWKGETHVVEVLTDGFAWRGAYYPSLSAIARAITGVRWSGPRFFGLRAKRPRSPSTAKTGA